MINLLNILYHDKVSFMWLLIMLSLMIASFIQGNSTNAGVLMLVCAYSFRGMYWEWLYKNEVERLNKQIHELNKLLLEYR
jgi:hypothetical protein